MDSSLYGTVDAPAERPALLTPEALARETLGHCDLGALEAIGSVYRPHDSIAIGVQTERGRYRLWRYHGFMPEEVVELQHAALAALAEAGVPTKRPVAARDGRTWRMVDGHLVTLFEWFGGWMPDLRDPSDLRAVARLHARWAQALTDFSPPIADWRELASKWRPRKGWAWVVPVQELPLVRERMGFFAAVRDLEDPPEHHERMLAQVRDTERRLGRFAERAAELRLAELPMGLNHGVFLFGLMDWELMVADADDLVYEPRIGDLARLIYALHDRPWPREQVRDLAMLAVETYVETVPLTEEELRALPLLAWSQQVFYDVFHVLLYIHEQSAPDRGAYLVAQDSREEAAKRDRLEQELNLLESALAG